MANGAAAASGALSGAAAGTAVMPGIGTAVGAVGGALAGLFSGGDSGASQEDIQAALNYYNGINSPTDLSDPLKLQQYLSGGTLTPEQLQKLNINADKATTLVENPADRAQQQASLNALKQLSQNGASATDQASLAAARSGVAQDTQAKIQSLLQQQQMRGQSDSGSTLAAQLSAIQGGNQQASKDAITTAANSEAARNQALQQYAQLAGQIRGQDVGTQQYNMNNDIQRQNFLDQNSLSRQQGNTSANNNAQLYNLQRSQSVGDTNTGAYNQELARQKQAEQQQYQDALAKANSLAGIRMGQAKNDNEMAANSAQNFSNISSGVGQLATAGSKSGLWSNLFGSPSTTSTTNGTNRPGGTITS